MTRCDLAAPQALLLFGAPPRLPKPPAYNAFW
jgi:hypothetical protein